MGREGFLWVGRRADDHRPVEDRFIRYVNQVAVHLELDPGCPEPRHDPGVAILKLHVVTGLDDLAGVMPGDNVGQRAPSGQCEGEGCSEADTGADDGDQDVDQLGCWSTWPLFVHPIAGDPTLQMQLTATAGPDSASLPAQLPATATSDLSLSHPGAETVLLGVHGFEVDSEEGERLVGFVLEADPEDNGYSLEELDSPAEIRITTHLDVAPAIGGGVLFRLSVSEEARSEHADASTVRRLVYWDGGSGNVVELSHDDLLTEEVTAADWSEVSVVRETSTFFPTESGQLLFWSSWETVVERYDCTAHTAVWDEGGQTEDAPINSDDPCCRFQATHLYDEAGWDFDPIGDEAFEVLFIEPHEATEYVPEECAFE